MLRITVKNVAQAAVLKVEGRLVGPWVGELLCAWNELSAKKPEERVALDLSDVTFVDATGKMMLGSMLRKGVKLENAHLFTKYIVDQVKHSVEFRRPRRRLI